ncbi:MAG: hypothetical protein QG585_141 [Patescibacteria group bacterium]|nr:hypothetical protein [Patescibacteria group bacterium]
MLILPPPLNSCQLTHLSDIATENRGLYLHVTEGNIGFYSPTEFGHGFELNPRVLFDPIPEDPQRFSVRLVGRVSVDHFCREVQERKPDHWIDLIQIDCLGGYIFVSYTQMNILVDASEVWEQN